MPLLRRKAVEQELLEYLPARTQSIRILYEQGPHIVVEVPPQRFLTHLGEGGRGKIEFPMPWSAYFIDLDVNNSAQRIGNLPERYARYEAAHSRVCSIFGLNGPADHLDKTNLYYLPLPNFYAESLTFCSNHGKPIAENSTEHAAALAISDFWAGGFRYYRVPRSAEKAAIWTKMGNPKVEGHTSVGRHWGVYKKWLACSPEELCTYPFGRHSINTIKERLDSNYAFYESYI